MTKTKITIIVTGVFSIAAALGSTILTPEQRETIIQLITTLL